jgi:hypothetical protein
MTISPSRLSATVLALAALCATPATAGLITFTGAPGNWLEQVSAVQGRAYPYASYFGYAANFTPVNAPVPNLGPSVPGGFGPFNGPSQGSAVHAFFGPADGSFGISGTSDWNASVEFEQDLQFSSIGTGGLVTMTVHLQGSVANVAPDAGDNDYINWNLAMVNGKNTTNYSWGVCSPTVAGEVPCGYGTSVDKDVSLSVYVNPGDVVYIQIYESGHSNDSGSFDGIDPGSVSLQLPAGLTLASGVDLPQFETAATAAPEPSTAVLSALAIAGLVGVMQRSRRVKPSRI